MAHENTGAKSIVDQMMENDKFSQWLGINRLEEKEGYCQLSMTVRPEMCNGFGIAHGGITFSLADSALAFASNSRGKHAVSIETSISHVKPVHVGDTLLATCEEQSLGNRTGIYYVKVENQSNEQVALFKGTVFRKDTDWKLSR